MWQCPRLYVQKKQLWVWPGPLLKVMCTSLSTIFSTEYMGLRSGAIRSPSQALLLKTPPFWLDWELALSMISGWEHCLLWELEIGVQCRQKEHTWVSSFQWYRSHLAPICFWIITIFICLGSIIISCFAINCKYILCIYSITEEHILQHITYAFLLLAFLSWYLSCYWVGLDHWDVLIWPVF